MSKTINIKKGYDIRLVGEAAKSVTMIQSAKHAVKPTDFIGLTPKLLVQVGDEVKAGTPIIFNKHDERVVITSPVSGTVEAINRGEKRLLEEIVIKTGTGYQSESFDIKYTPDIERAKLIELLLKSGLWASIRQRPFSVIANPDDTPRDIYVTAMDTAPLAIDLPFVIKNSLEDFQEGINALKILGNKNIQLGLPHGCTELDSLKNVDITYYKGPHPAGNLSVHINKTSPINKGEIIWYAHPQDIIIIGRLCRHGHVDTTITIPVCGSQVESPQYFTTRKGVCIDTFADIINTEETNRYISGNVLSGTKIKENGFLGFYENQFTVIPEGNEYEFFGWIKPGLDKPSFSRTFMSWLQPNKKYKANANLHGGNRALVVTGEYEKVFPLDIYPMQLIKACIAENIDDMENLGIYEVDEEDFALPEFIDPSKTEIQHIIREGLDLIRKEMQ
ncbi:MAG: Na(+)-translocating NADH-quinone reductase subunit A [Bacteroidales bacterium]|jgi:Na+-transporting NADH:ubiquinone oxidoreductase subunit A